MGSKSIEKEGFMANFGGMISSMLGFLKKSDSNIHTGFSVVCLDFELKLL